MQYMSTDLSTEALAQVEDSRSLTNPQVERRGLYITTPIYYVNALPHIGTAYTSVAADVMARFMRLTGASVKFLTGTDEHGQKVAQSAKAAGCDPQEFVDRISVHFRELTPLLHLSPDDFIRTTEERHKKAAQALWQKMVGNGHIYLSKYAGWYSVRDETFFAEAELVDGKAPNGNEVEWVEEPSYFFNLSQWQEPLLKFYAEHPDFIGPEGRRREVLSFVKGGLRDLSVSRSSLTWGVPVPGDERHVMYVWVDALTNYLSALGFPDESARDYITYWPQAVHLVGKDILRFHAVYWPAFLMAAGLTPPKRVFAHGWWTVENQKISKSLGNTIDPKDLVAAYGVDAVRYFLMREVPFGQDGDFSKKALVRRINADLANDLGNLVQRVLSFIHKHAGAQVPAPQAFSKEDHRLLDQVKALSQGLLKFVETQELHKICEALWAVVADANRYVDRQEPWTLRKTDPARMETVLYVLGEVLRHIGILSSPLIPGGAGKILDQLQVPFDQRQITHLASHPLIPGTPLPQPEGIFPRFQEEEGDS